MANNRVLPSKEDPIRLPHKSDSDIKIAESLSLPSEFLSKRKVFYATKN